MCALSGVVGCVFVAYVRTVKTASPPRFGSLADAHAFMAGFTHAYNHEHHHSGIGLHTPADVHYGHARTVSANRSATLTAARLAQPRTVRQR